MKQACHYWLGMLLLVGLPSSAAITQSAFTNPTPAERIVLDMTNRDRTAQGLPALQWNPALAAAAMQHAQKMVQTSDLSHDLPGEESLVQRTAQAGAHFSAVAENIAYGPSPAIIEQEWMRSVAHRTNILDDRMNAVGIALIPAAGTLWAVEDFAATTPELSAQGVKQAVSAVLVAKGLAISAAGSPEQDAARVACPQFEGDAGAHARFVVRYESADPTTLPQPLSAALASGQYTRAAVASCPSTNTRNRNFAAYRVAVVLF